MTQISLSARNVVKRYGGVIALSDGNLEVRSGEVVALLGANGSGKSTLSKIITGLIAPTSGEVILDGKPVQFRNPQAARRQGITAVYQELSLIPNMNVAENIWLAHEPAFVSLAAASIVNPAKRRAETEKLLALFQGAVSRSLQPETPVHALPPDERQIVEILKALSQNPRLLILDEATASLDAQQVQRLFDLISQWKASGMGIVFVSHRMEEIFRVADSATVLRSGKTVNTVNIADVDERQIVAMMVEGTVSPHETKLAPVSPDSPVRLRVSNLNTSRLKQISLEVRDGELLGIGGLQGQGQAHLLLSLFGAEPFSGNVEVGGEKVHFRTPRQAMRSGVAFVPGDRGSEGLVLIRSILENLHLPSWRRFGLPLNMKEAHDEGTRIAADLRMVMSSLNAPVSSLSGGNAQKVVIGKWLLREPKLLLLNDPTKGIDVGAKGEFYALLAQLRQAGTAILLYSSDDEELLGLCDRVLVLQDGRIVSELSGEQLNKTNLVAASMGSA
jgi:ribose transport system ATP-binding protein